MTKKKFGYTREKTGNGLIGGGIEEDSWSHECNNMNRATMLPSPHTNKRRGP